MRMAMVSMLALGLAACSPAGDGAVDGGGTRADGEVQMNAGKWTQTMVVEKFELPGAPPEVAQVLQQMVGNEQTSESCMTENEVAKGFEESAKKAMAGQSCKSQNFSAAGGNLTGRVVCEEPDGAGATMTIDGEYTADALDMQMTADITDPDMPGGKGQMVMRITGKRIGECDA